VALARYGLQGRLHVVADAVRGIGFFFLSASLAASRAGRRLVLLIAFSLELIGTEQLTELPLKWFDEDQLG
jgi:hypothetical protein